MSNNKIVIAIAVVILLVLAGGGYFIFGTKKPVKEMASDSLQEEAVPTLAPEDLGLVLAARADKKAVKFTINNIEGITGVDYEVSYEAEGNIPRGAIGHVDVKPGDSKISTNYIDLGTCSSGKCKYDVGVTSVKFILKIVKDDGKTYSTEKTLEL